MSRTSASTDRIVAAARSLFSSRGADAVTMAEIAEKAGVSRATVFNRVGSKHALLDRITEGVLARYREFLHAALADRDAPVPKLLRDLFAAMGTGIEKDSRLYRLVFREIAKLAVGMDEGGAGERARRAARWDLEQLLTRGQARGEISTDFRPDDLASAFDSLVFGTITHWLFDDASERLASRMTRAAEVYLGTIEERGKRKRRSSSAQRRR